MFQDIQSVEEFEKFENNKFNKISYSFVDEKISRGAFRNIELTNKIEKGIIQKYFGLISCIIIAYLRWIKCISNKSRKKKKYHDFKFLDIRLHPALRSKFDLRFIRKLKLPSQIKIRLRNETSASPQYLISRADIVVSADSNLLNFSLYLNKLTFGVYTDFRFEPPINIKFKKVKILNIFKWNILSSSFLRFYLGHFHIHYHPLMK